jgi:hypothetical protein
MGYDCTLHVVDEQMIRGPFVERLLGKKGDSAFDRRKDAATLWKQVRDELDANDAHTAANHVCQLAIAFCAADLPYHYERGFCLSLWPDLEERRPMKVPPKLIGKPEELFDNLVKKYPNLRGKFPKKIEGNNYPGLFIPSQNVPALLEWTRKKMKLCSKPDQRLFRGLLLVLEEAAARGLAYWEGTEIPVESRTMRPSQPAGTAEESLLPGWEDHHYSQPITIGSTTIMSDNCGKTHATAFIDLSNWPPTIQTNDEFTVSAARSAGGRYSVVSSRVEEPLHCVRVRESSWGAPSTTPKLQGRLAKINANRVGFIGERVIAFLSARATEKIESPPLIESHDRKSLVPIKGVPQLGMEREYGWELYKPGVVHLNDGSDIVVWHEKGCELRGEKLVSTFENVGKPDYQFAGFAWGEDGFFFVGQNEQRHRQLYHIRRGCPRVPHAQRVENVMRVERGPDHSVILKQGDNKKGTLGVIYFPDEQAYIPIEPELFRDEDPDEIHALLFSEGSRRLIAATPSRLWAVPIAPLLEAPRFNAVTGRAIKK